MNLILVEVAVEWSTETDISRFVVGQTVDPSIFLLDDLSVEDSVFEVAAFPNWSVRVWEAPIPLPYVEVEKGCVWVGCSNIPALGKKFAGHVRTSEIEGQQFDGQCVPVDVGNEI